MKIYHSVDHLRTTKGKYASEVKIADRPHSNQVTRLGLTCQVTMGQGASGAAADGQYLLRGIPNAAQSRRPQTCRMRDIVFVRGLGSSKSPELRLKRLEIAQETQQSRAMLRT